MNKFAYIFPGQGSQYIGMARELYEKSAVAIKLINKANEILGFDIKKLMFEGPAEELKLTRNCQPAILLHSIAALETLKINSNANNLNPNFLAGLSLGEYTALVASGVFKFEDTLALVRKRALLMEEVSKKNPGSMAAVLGLDRDKVKEICSQAGVDMANLNCPGQIVISGIESGITRAKELAEAAGAKNVVILEVSIASHSSLMMSMAHLFLKELENTSFAQAKIPVISNVTAKEELDPALIRSNLEKQLHFPVLWEDSIRYIASKGVDTFLEIGPGKVLKGLLRRIDSNLKVINIEKSSDIDNLM